jgi:hypothetical protein
MKIGQLGVLATFAIFAGCGVVLVDFDISLTGSVRELSDTAAPEVRQGVKQPRYAGALNPFQAVQYRDQTLEWTFSTGANGFGGTLRNLGGSELCFQFDRARISSNFMPAGAPFVVHYAYLGKGHKALGSNRPEDRPVIVPPAVCLQPGEKREVAFRPDMRKLFPNDRLFNVYWEDHRPDLLERGVGNWLTLSVPLEQSGKQRLLDVTLRPTDAQARSSYY